VARATVDGKGVGTGVSAAGTADLAIAAALMNGGEYRPLGDVLPKAADSAGSKITSGSIE